MRKAAKKKQKRSTASSGWNEFNTFSKLIYPYLEEELGYPARKSEYFDEQTWVRKGAGKSGPYDGAFQDDRGVLVLIEAKRQGKSLESAEMKQAFDYCLGGTFPVPPPYVLVSNGEANKWFRRNRSSSGEYSYSPCDEIKWKKAKQESGSGVLTEQLTLKELIRLLSRLRKIIYQDLIESYFPDKFSLKNNKLGSRKKGFEEILNTRKTFVDPTLADAKDEKAIKFVLSSIALSITLKLLFLKITTDRRSEVFPKDVKAKIKKLASSYPGILIAKPYDVLDISNSCESICVKMLKPVSILQALNFDGSDNPIGDVWDGLVGSEEQDLQVESLGNVYTPDPIVKAMVNSAEKSLNGWRNKNVLEPSCGSGHFVREIYKRLRDTYLNSETGARVSPAKAHILAMEHIRGVDIDPFAVQTTQLGMFLELYREQAVWKELAPKNKFDFSKVVDRGDFLDTGFETKFARFQPDLVIGNPPYGISVQKEIADEFEVGNSDSYGCFIVRALDLLKVHGTLSYIVSNTFLTTRTHRQLRRKIVTKSSPRKIMQLHRNAFAGRDVFACMIELEKIESRELSSISATESYTYFDAWPIHPSSDLYPAALSRYYGEPATIDPEKFGEYNNPLVYTSLRYGPPKVEINPNQSTFFSRTGLSGRDHFLSFSTGRTSLSQYCVDDPLGNRILQGRAVFADIQEVECLIHEKANIKIPVVKLWQIATVLQGLATADDETFLRKSEGIIANARRRNLKSVAANLAITGDRLAKLTASEKESGIDIVDFQSEPHFVPFDKGGEQDTAAGEFRNFWTEVDYWIDWSKKSVSLLKKRNRFKPGTPKKPRFQNSVYYFRKGIICTVTGLYAPTYQLSFGGVFGHKANLMAPFREEIVNYLLVLLSSRLMRYFAKAFICNTVDFSTDYFKHLPIVVPTAAQLASANAIANQAIDIKKSGIPGATAAIDLLVEPFVNELYHLTDEEKSEINTWFKRRYPHLGRSS